MTSRWRSSAPDDWKLESYTYEQGPAYPKGRKRSESVGDFIRRIQIAELRKGGKNIFADVPMHYSVPRPRLAPIPPRLATWSEYEAVMAPKREAARPVCPACHQKLQMAA